MKNRIYEEKLTGIPPAPKGATAATALLFLFAFCLYAFLLQGAPPGSDPAIMFKLAESLSLKGTVEIDPDPTLGLVPSKSGGFTSKYGIGQSLIEAPFCRLAAFLAKRGGILPDPMSNYRYFFLFFISALSVPFVCAGALAAFFRLGLKLGYGLGVSLLSAVILGLATQMEPAARFAFSEPLIAFCLIGAVAFLFPAQEKHRVFHIGAGFLLGLAIAAKLAIAPAAILIVGIHLWERRQKGYSCASLLAELAPGLAFFAAVILAYNYARFGVFTEEGYKYGKDAALGFSTPLSEGLFGLIASPGKGFFFYSPILILALPGLFRLPARAKSLPFVAFGALAVLTFTFSKWWAWHGDWCWGPRFLLPAVPLLAIGLFPLLDRFAKLQAAVKALFLAALAASFFVQILGTTVNFYEYLDMAAAQRPQTFGGEADRLAERDSIPHVHFDLTFSPFRGHFWIFRNQLKFWLAGEKDLDAMRNTAPWHSEGAPGLPVDPDKSLWPDFWHSYFPRYFPESAAWVYPLRNVFAAGALAFLIGLIVVGRARGPAPKNRNAN